MYNTTFTPPSASTKPRDIDRGRAWFVLIACYLGCFTVSTTMFVAGVMYLALLEKFQEGNTKTSLVGAISSGVLCITGPLASAFHNKFSCRVGIISGCLILTVANATSAFMPNLDGLIFSAGFLTGIGYSLSMTGTVVCIGHYFDQYRDKVVSAIFITVGMGLFVGSPLGMWLLDTYGLTGSFLSLGCIHAQLCVIGMLCPPSTLEKRHMKARNRGQTSARSCSLSNSINLSILRKKELVLFIMSISSWNFAFYVAVMHLPNFMTQSSSNEADVLFLMTSLSVANICGRLIGVSLSWFRLCDNLHINTTVLAISGVLSTLFPFYYHTMAGKIAFSIQLGVSIGIPNVLMTVISIRLAGTSSVSEANGFSFFACGIGGILGPIIAGYVVDVSGNYLYSFVVVGVVLIVGALCSFSAWFIVRLPDHFTPRDTKCQQEMEIFVKPSS